MNATQDAPTTYAARVAANLRHMETPSSEWKALAPLGTHEDEEGRTMPVFDFESVKDYKTAPTLYRQGPSTTCCELFGKIGLKYVYHIKNDSRQWLLAIGSECVTHFQDDNGQAMAKGAQDEINKAALFAALDARREIFRSFTFTSTYYSRTQTNWRDSRAYKVYMDLRTITGKLDRESGTAAITRWTRTKGPKAAELVAQANNLLSI